MPVNFNEVFTYDETSKSFLRWNTDIFTRKECLSPRIFKGTEVGNLDPSGYWRTEYKGRKYQLHRIVYEMFHGSIPEGLLVDHIDGNKGNNRLSNLRVVSSHVNMRNQKKHKRNSTGVTGVSYEARKDRSPSFRAHYVDFQGAIHRKTFTVSVHGYEGAFTNACKWRENQLELLNAHGASYSERHGK